MANHQKKDKQCPFCDKIIWQSSKMCGSCGAKKANLKRNTEDYRKKLSRLAKSKGFGKWMKGKKLTKEWKINIGLSSRERYKENVKYTGIHMWVYSRLGKANKCEYCRIEGKRRYHWASLKHTYDRDVNKWIQLCPSCHSKYDKQKIQL